jgi:hypothetical protein
LRTWSLKLVLERFDGGSPLVDPILRRNAASLGDFGAAAL